MCRLVPHLTKESSMYVSTISFDPVLSASHALSAIVQSNENQPNNTQSGDDLGHGEH